jgi:hypothetical protein
MQITKNFNSSEIACPDCGDTNIRLITMEKAQWVRDELGVPLYVPLGGGKRCLSYHLSECGDYPSAHTSGEAIDLYMQPYSIYNMFKIARLMREAGFLRIGLYPTYKVKSVHGDLWFPRPSEAWVMTKRGYIYFRHFEEAVRYVKKNYLKERR